MEIKFKNIIVSRIIIIGILIVSCNLKAEDTLTWKDCIEYALDHNMNLKKEEYSAEIQIYNYKNAWNNYVPSADFQSGYKVTYGRSVNDSNDVVFTTNYSNSYSLNSSVALFQGFRRMNMVKFEKINLDISKENYEVQKNRIMFDVLNEYTQLLYNEGLLEVSQQQFEVSKKEAYRTSRLKELGRVAGADLLEARAKMAADSFQLIQAQGQLKLAALNLKELMNYPIDKEIYVQEIGILKDVFSNGSTNPDEILGNALNLLPEIKRVELELYASEKNLAILKGNYYPSLGFGAGWGSGYSQLNGDVLSTLTPSLDLIDRNDNTSWGISLNVPLFNSFHTRNSIQRGKLRIKQAQLDYDIELYKAKTDVYKLIAEFETSKSEFLAASRNVEQQEKLFQTAVKRRESGLISLVEFNIINNQLSFSKAEYYRTLLQLFLKSKYIEFYMNGEILD